MATIDLPLLLLALAGIALAVALSVLAGKLAARLLYAASEHSKTGR